MDLKCRVPDIAAATAMPCREVFRPPDISMVNAAIPAGCWDLDLATGMLALCLQSRTMSGLNRQHPTC
jgi:hypothetical protein